MVAHIVLHYSLAGGRLRHEVEDHVKFARAAVYFRVVGVVLSVDDLVADSCEPGGL
jgi:hypothetical protein